MRNKVMSREQNISHNSPLVFGISITHSKYNIKMLDTQTYLQVSELTPVDGTSPFFRCGETSYQFKMYICTFCFIAIYLQITS